VLEGLRGEASIAELCRKEGIAQSMYYGWSKEFLEAGKRRLAGDTAPKGHLRRGEDAAGRGARAQGGAGRGDAGDPARLTTRTERETAMERGFWITVSSSAGPP
jgi:transposase-like protein